jgi:hypothetical protein
LSHSIILGSTSSVNTSPMLLIGLFLFIMIHTLD